LGLYPAKTLLQAKAQQIQKEIVTAQPCHCEAVIFRRNNLLGKAAGCFGAKPVLSLPREPPLAVISAPGLSSYRKSLRLLLGSAEFLFNPL
jgi:hypothetical protein